MNLTPFKRMNVFLAIILFLILIAGFFFIVFPTLDRIHTLETQIQVEEAFLKELENINPKQEQGSDSNKTKHTVPETAETDRIVLDLRKAESVSKSEIQEITLGENFEAVSDLGQFEELQAELTTLEPLILSVLVKSSSIDEVKKFINEVESADRLYKVNSFDMTSSEDLKEPLTFQLVLSAYYQKR